MLTDTALYSSRASISSGSRSIATR
jgi:hypothetical protein